MLWRNRTPPVWVAWLVVAWALIAWKIDFLDMEWLATGGLGY